jgi:phosphatidylglycerophosphate synthase
MKSIAELRKDQYQYNCTLYPYIKDWRKNPYTFLKARLYMEASAILVFLLLKTKTRPNSITITYGLAGILGGVLLSIPSRVTILLALFIFFTKGILDWSDGHLARVTGQVSVTGHVLDVYGAFLNDLGLQMGLGFYVAFRAGNPTYYYLIPLIPFFFAASLNTFSRAVLFAGLSKKKTLDIRIQRYTDAGTIHETAGNAKASVLGKYMKYFGHFSSFLDARARSVDFICLLVLIETFTNISVTWIIFIALTTKAFVSFVGGYYITIKRNWVEKSLDAALYNIRNSLKDDM